MTMMMQEEKECRGVSKGAGNWPGSLIEQGKGGPGESEKDGECREIA